jgi:hypothetical protein
MRKKHKTTTIGKRIGMGDSAMCRMRRGKKATFLGTTSVRLYISEMISQVQRLTEILKDVHQKETERTKVWIFRDVDVHQK